MTQTLANLQDQLTQANLSIAGPTEEVRAPQDAVTHTAGTEVDAERSDSNPLVRLSFMSMVIGSDRRRIDGIEKDTTTVKEAAEALTGATINHQVFVTSQLKELDQRIQEAQDVQGRGSGQWLDSGSEHRSEPKFLIRENGFQNLKSYNGDTSTQWKELRFGVMT